MIYGKYSRMVGCDTFKLYFEVETYEEVLIY